MTGADQLMVPSGYKVASTSLTLSKSLSTLAIKTRRNANNIKLKLLHHKLFTNLLKEIFLQITIWRCQLLDQFRCNVIVDVMIDHRKLLANKDVIFDV